MTRIVRCEVEESEKGEKSTWRPRAREATSMVPSDVKAATAVEMAVGAVATCTQTEFRRREAVH